MRWKGGGGGAGEGHQRTRAANHLQALAALVLLVATVGVALCALDDDEVRRQVDALQRRACPVATGAGPCADATPRGIATVPL